MKRLGVIANLGKPEAPAALKRLAKKAAKLGLELLSDEATAKFLGHCKVVARAEIVGKPDAIIAMGGDGTMLRAVRELDGRDKPLIGVNLGSLGFMTSVAEEDIERALESLVAGKYLESIRAMAECVVDRNGKEVGRYRALNDVVVTSGKSVRILSLEMSIDNQHVTSYACDGLIVSTPTGSTGHSMSAGGPIVQPDTQAFVISLICPHSLSSRPLVVPDKSEISVRIEESEGDILLSIDGQEGYSLSQGDCVKVKRSSKSVRFIHLTGYSYFAVLRQKLHWRGSVLG
jgi:NAD+ kinase